MKEYDHKKIEKKWQTIWQENKVYKTLDNSKKKKFYVLDMFPYVSGEGIHVGHPKGYIATDVVSRMKRMQGFNVLHPMGFDAFGLPAENYAIKTKTNPVISVAKNIARFKKQLAIIGFDYDWEREVNTSDPKFYKWTQWIFLKLLEKGLAYESNEPVNWCPKDRTVLANEDVEDGKCERCGTIVEKKPIRQWVLKITDYADRLLADLDELDWPESIKESQKNWIGRSEGAEINFQIIFKNGGKPGLIPIFTTRPDTIFGATYLVLSPEHPWVTLAIDDNHKGVIDNVLEVGKYVKEVKNKNDIERTSLDKVKTGVELKGVKAINPATREEIPVWIADYVLLNYGTGAVMAVPADDARDREFSEKFKLPIFENYQKAGFEDFGKKVIKFKLRDWVFSRQRYWGEPIPILRVVDPEGIEGMGKVIPVKEKDLPVKLPKVKSYEPTGTAESPLANVSNWINVKKGQKIFKRESNTMPQWAGSSWYYLRYMDPKNNKALVDKKKEKYWNMVDLYVGGAEHATRHLIYARFWHKFLYDIGVVENKEPFKRLQHVGLIIASDGRKMSKRFGNIINPDTVIHTFGADTLRLYEMFMGPFDQAVAWSEEAIIGPRRFLERVWKIGKKVKERETKDFLSLRPRSRKGREPTTLENPLSPFLQKLLHKTIKKVTEDIEAMKFNTAISSLMIFMNEVEKFDSLSSDVYKKFLQILAPFAPHITEELWNMLGEKKSIHLSSWPKYDSEKIKDKEIKIIVQINGKVRAEILVEGDETEENIKQKSLKNEAVSKYTEDKEIKKIIYVKNRLINIVL
ncbi:leucine--tRNA ligase [Candidatus Nomurabacteria bacterium RIFCSPHIGHO2_02_FULL_37_45]|uniref:Leucine--tRNA ligase n=2 Tax=Candidatus Nomuraibacteriota TaxID=1752729 RepID=A0A1F6Y7D1_9BACT|nr:MAG: leucine--tRNA ligase [Candidatus Nomurabacteria bacterium RIFCSPHIGHO2_01_FULL_37_110]OGI71236.1 MAG: leucine--tRNA ligase [Candidatus Nomurabacteria bacterium RIFCSPHIGHO2_02_FULL_37_45]OGI79293.1 MAG: leucine--tRNA ligase [Candidatus Nomurabacteria bacterium RIFCSPHIGHO2_12_FULL_37_29]OGI84842.1 MAG: leucine--tRNA ligase [Candidatus Nomurabacteria bacterium RIFCSPLOWO2_01_FULL_37_49]OGJ02246.1 MAG: leucine--tRNA ligase [Candidatus Nomurabacteria bacterium RIFCSPLOWO2_12_FULL_37_8]